MNVRDELIIVNHIGTSVESVIDDELGLLVEDIKKALTSDAILAFSSIRAIEQLAQKNIKIDHIYDSILWAASKYKVIKVLTTHLVGGLDYERVKSFCEEKAKEFIGHDMKTDTVLIQPLLTEIENILQLVYAIARVIQEQNMHILFVGHGTTHSSEKFYGYFIEAYKKIWPDISFITLNTNVEKEIKNLPKEMVLFPLLTVNGHHIQNDIFDGDNSIYNKLSKLGTKVYKYDRGLLSYEEIRKLYVNALK